MKTSTEAFVRSKRIWAFCLQRLLHWFWSLLRWEALRCKILLNVAFSWEKSTPSFWHPKVMSSTLAKVNILPFYFPISSFLPPTQTPLSQHKTPNRALDRRGHKYTPAKHAHSRKSVDVPGNLSVWTLNTEYLRDEFYWWVGSNREASLRLQIRLLASTWVQSLSQVFLLELHRPVQMSQVAGIHRSQLAWIHVSDSQ